MMSLPAIRIHSLEQARLSLEQAKAAGRSVRLVLGGPLGWAACAALRDQAQAAVPGVTALWIYDPAGRAGYAALALRQGAAAVIWPPRDRRHASLQDLAAATGGHLVAPVGRHLDLALVADPRAALRRLLDVRLADSAAAS